MNLSILYVNDVHGYLQPHAELFYEGAAETVRTVGGYSRIAGYINEVRTAQPNTLVFDGGDTFHGTLPAVQTKGEILIPVLNELRLDAMVGHWDFAYGPQQLQHLAAQLTYPVLGINVYNEDESLFLQPYTIRQVENRKVAVIGICCNIIDKTMPARFSKGLTITDGKTELPAYIKEVKAKGADIVILLSHNGFPQDCALLSQVDGVDICLSAHTHNRLYEAITVNHTIIIQCGCHGSFLGHLDLQWRDDKIINWTYNLKTVDESFPESPSVRMKVEEALAAFDPLRKEEIGYTPRILHRYNSLNASMDNVLLAAMKWHTGMDVAFSNGWRYGVPIAKGPVTMFDLFDIIPHNPPVETTDLKGEEIRLMLEENLEHTFSSHPMEQMGGYVKRCAGLTAYVKIENPRGHRVQELYIGAERYRKAQRYAAAFVTEQGVPKKYGTNRQKTATSAVDAMAAFFKADLLTVDIIENRAIISV